MVTIKKLCLLALLLLSLNLDAQQSYESAENTKVEMADGLRKEGKIYVVVAVVSTILAGLIVYAVTLDRRLRKLEHENSSE